MLHWVALNLLLTTAKIRFFCADETRIGLKTLTGRKITKKGIKPLGEVQSQFQATFLYEIVESLTEEHLFWKFSHLNTDCFQIFLNLISQEFEDSLLIIQLDNGAFHKAKRLRVPNNIILFFQPAHCPELNPIEQVWQYLKRRLRWSMPKNLEELRQDIKVELEKLTPLILASMTVRHDVLSALSVVDF